MPLLLDILAMIVQEKYNPYYVRTPPASVYILFTFIGIIISLRVAFVNIENEQSLGAARDFLLVVMHKQKGWEEVK